MTQKFKFVIPGSDAGANAKFTQFRTGFAANFGALNFDASALDEVIAAQTDFNTALLAAENAKTVAANAVTTKDNARRSSTTEIRLWAQRVINNTEATPAILASMGIVPVSAPSSVLNPPTELSAAPNADGTCLLRYKSNGNRSGTTYVLEQSVNGAPWAWLGSTTKLRFEDGGALPGVPKLYRVRAQRGDVTTAPSAQASIYGGEGLVELSLAA